MVHEFIEKYLREKFADERREALRGFFLAGSLGILATIPAYFCLQFFGLMLGMSLYWFGLLPVVAWLSPPAFLFFSTLLYPLFVRRTQRQYIALGDTPDAQVVRVATMTREADSFDIFELGGHFTIRRLVLSMVLAPAKFFWLTMRELRLFLFPRGRGAKHAARVIEALLGHGERVSFAEAAKLPGVNLRAAVKLLAQLEEVQLLVSPPGIALTPDARVTITEYIEDRDGVAPEIIYAEKPVLAPPPAKPAEVVEIPAEIANGSGELPPQPLPPDAEGVMAAPVGRLPERPPAGDFNPFALLVDGDAGKLEPVVAPQIVASPDEKPLEIA